MAYILKEVTIRTNNTEKGISQISELWKDISAGKLPVLFDSEHNFVEGISPISKYSNYENGEKGDYDISIVGVNRFFFEDIEKKVENGLYKKYEAIDDNGNIELCTKKAWKKVWDDTDTGTLKRAFTIDYESSVPAEYTKDSKAHCYLYISVRR